MKDNDKITEGQYFFYNVIKNKKDKELKRGACVRSLSIASKNL